ncbi:MAG TPA: hypothetical protein VGM17_12675 [Rhizomicrobium sp.]|jgi:hypothetical protein
MTLFLHIGIGKTGTTSIQTFLEMNAGPLAERGIVMPTTLGRRNHRRLTMYALNDDVIDNSRRARRLLTPAAVEKFRTHTFSEFRAEVAQWPPHDTVVMTSEQMTRLRRPGEIARLKDLVSLSGQQDIRVIVYLRRQDLYYVSEYSQEVKGGKDIPFRPNGKVVNRDIYFYDRLIGYWADVFGPEAIIVRPFEPSALRNGDAIDDFLSVIGVDDLSGMERPPPRNASLDAYTVEFLRRLNPAVPRWVDGGESATRRLLVEALEKISHGPKLRMSRENAQKFLALFAESNAMVARRYLSKEKLFEEDVEQTVGMEPELPAEAAQPIAAALFSTAILPALDCDELVAATGRAWNEVAEKALAPAKPPRDSQAA